MPNYQIPHWIKNIPGFIAVVPRSGSVDPGAITGPANRMHLTLLFCRVCYSIAYILNPKQLSDKNYEMQKMSPLLVE